MCGAPVIHDSRVSLKQIIKEKPFLLLILAELLFFWRPVFLGDVFFFRDLSGHFLPVRQLVAEYITDFEPPLWDPYRQGGKPLLANPNNMALYPANLLYTFLNANTALTLDIIGHHLLGLLAMYILARFLSVAPVASFIAAIVYSFAGYSLSLINVLNWHIAAAYLPVLLCFWHLYLTAGKKIWWGLCVLAASLQLLAGAPELTLLTMITLLGWGMFCPYPCDRRKVLFSFVLLFFFAAAITAIQILPAAENARVTIRAVGFSFDSATKWSLHPFRLPELIFPEFLGHYNSSSGNSYWGENLEGQAPFFLSIYFGLPAVVFVSTVLWNSGVLKERPGFFLFLFMLLLASLIGAAGRHLPFLRSIFESLSLRSPFRFPIKLIGSAILPMSLLAAMGAQALFAGKKNSRAVIVFWILALVLFVLLFFSRAFLPRMIEVVFAREPDGAIEKGLIAAILHCLLIWTLLCICLTIQHRRQVLPLVAFVFALDLLVAGQNVNFYAPPTIHSDIPPIVDALKTHIQDGKLYRTGANFRLGQAPTDEFYWRHWQQKQLLFRDEAAKYGIPVIFHDDLDGSALLELDYISVVIAGLPWKQKLPVLAATGVKLILTDQEFTEGGAPRITRIANPYSREFLIYSIDNGLPPVSFASQSIRADSARQALALMVRPAFDPANQVIVSETESRSLQPCNQFRVVKKEIKRQKRSFLIETGCAGYIVFSDPHYPGWRTYVNGKEAELQKTNIIVSSIYLPAGRYEIERRYLPRTVMIGALCSLSALILFTILVLTKNKRLLGFDRTQNHRR